jgi:addiction module RelB/DinJ family antitoxin
MNFELQCSSKDRRNIMTTNAVVRARIDEHIKEEASAVLASMGLTISDAFRMLRTNMSCLLNLLFQTKKRSMQ